MKSDRNPALASEHGGTWNKDNITYQNLGVKLRHEGNYLSSKEIEKKQMIRIHMHAHYTKGDWLKLSGMVLLGSFKIS